MASITVHDKNKISGALAWCSSMLKKGIVGGAVVITFGRESRTKEQNDKMWAMLADFEPIVFNGRHWKKKDWKVFMMSALNQEMPAVGLLGEPVTLNTDTRDLGKKRFSELVEFIYAEGSHRGVIWSDKALEVYEEYREHHE